MNKQFIVVLVLSLSILGIYFEVRDISRTLEHFNFRLASERGAIGFVIPEVNVAVYLFLLLKLFVVLCWIYTAIVVFKLDKYGILVILVNCFMLFPLGLISAAVMVQYNLKASRKGGTSMGPSVGSARDT